MQSAIGKPAQSVADVDRPEQQVALLVVDGVGQVDHLDVVVGADVADRVGRVDAEAEDVEVVLVAQALEVGERRRDRGERRRRSAIADARRARSDPRVRALTTSESSLSVSLPVAGGSVFVDGFWFLTRSRSGFEVSNAAASRFRFRRLRAWYRLGRPGQYGGATTATRTATGSTSLHGRIARVRVRSIVPSPSDGIRTTVDPTTFGLSPLWSADAALR